MIIVTNMLCCGVKEISGLSDTKICGAPNWEAKAVVNIVRATTLALNWNGCNHPAVLPRAGEPKRWCMRCLLHKFGYYYTAFQRLLFPFIVFTSVGSYGREFADFVTKQGLGVVTKTKPKLNNNSNNMLTVWVWAINRERLAEFYEAHKAEL